MGQNVTIPNRFFQKNVEREKALCGVKTHGFPVYRSSLERIQGKCLIRIAWASVRLGSPGSQLVWMRLLRGVACMCGVIDPIRQAWQVMDDNLDSCRM